MTSSSSFIVEHADAIFEYFSSTVSPAERAKLIKVSRKEVQQEFKPDRNAIVCKCISCAKQRVSFDQELESIVSHLYEAVSKSYIAEPNEFPVEQEEIYQFQEESGDSWEDYEDYYYDLVDIQGAEFIINEGVLQDKTKFKAMLEHVANEVILSRELKEFSPADSTVITATGGSKYDDESDYGESDCEDDAGNIAVHVDEFWYLVQSSIGFIVSERITNLYKDKLASESRERFLRELELESQEKRTPAPKETEKPKKKSRRQLAASNTGPPTRQPLPRNPALVITRPGVVSVDMELLPEIEEPEDSLLLKPLSSPSPPLLPQKQFPTEIKSSAIRESIAQLEDPVISYPVRRSAPIGYKPSPELRPASFPLSGYVEAISQWGNFL